MSVTMAPVSPSEFSSLLQGGICKSCNLLALNFHSFILMSKWSVDRTLNLLPSCLYPPQSKHIMKLKVKLYLTQVSERFLAWSTSHEIPPYSSPIHVVLRSHICSHVPFHSPGMESGMMVKVGTHLQT